jgi:hypothetical protein
MRLHSCPNLALGVGSESGTAGDSIHPTVIATIL